MGLRDLFGLDNSKHWESFAGEMNGRFERGSWFGTDKVYVNYKYWSITMDTIKHGKITYTRFRIPCRSNHPLKLSVYSTNVVALIGKLFGMQDIVVGDPAFDEKFIVKGSDKRALEVLDAEIREYLLSHPYLYIKSRGEALEEITLEIAGVITHRNNLMVIFRFLTMVLDRLYIVNAINDVKAK